MTHPTAILGATAPTAEDLPAEAAAIAKAAGFDPNKWDIRLTGPIHIETDTYLGRTATECHAQYEVHPKITGQEDNQ